MLPVFLYCSAVFTILILYYFYKPVEIDSTNNEINSNEECADNEDDDFYSENNNNQISTAATSSTNVLNTNSKLTDTSSSVISSSNRNNETIVHRKGALMIRCESDTSIQTMGTVNMPNNNSDIEANSTAGLINKLIWFYKNYIVVNLGPLMKYLGISESRYTDIFIKNTGVKNSSNEELVKRNLPAQIEDNYKTLDELLNELIRLDILNIRSDQSAINNSVFNFETSSLLNTGSNSAAINSGNAFTCNVIIGIDFTSSNEWKGRKTFNSQSLHKTIGNKIYNPYQKVISILGFAVNKLINSSLTSNASVVNSGLLGPVVVPSSGNFNLHTGLKIYSFGFGDSTTTDKNCFSLFDTPNSNVNMNNTHSSDSHTNIEYAESFDEVLNRYNEIVKKINLSGPTSFAPIIYKSIEIIKRHQQHLYDLNYNARMSYHILFIIADGKISPECENETIKAIVEASLYPLSIVVIGVGDGPFNTMIKFDTRLCKKSKFDNFQFVDYHDTIKTNSKTPELAFALKALMEVPEQYKFMKQFNYI